MRIKLLCLIVAGIVLQQTVYGFVSAQRSLSLIRGIKKVSQQKKISEQERLRLFKDFIRVEGGCAYDVLYNVQDPYWSDFQAFRNTMKDGFLFSVLYQNVISTIKTSLDSRE